MSTESNDTVEWELEGEVPEVEAEKPEIEVEDDTPEEDRNRGVMPKEIVDELEKDDLEEYSEKVKTRLKQMKRVWHDERREKEREAREKAEALAVAQRYRAEAERLRSTLQEGEGYLIKSYKQAAEYEIQNAERSYRDAYEAGDADRITEAQRQLADAVYKLNQLNSYKPTGQTSQPEVEVRQEQPQAPQIDAKTRAWQERNTWYGSDSEMTASALGLHQKLATERGPQFVGSDEYWQLIDKTMRRRFPEYFGDEVASGVTTPAPRETKPAPVVAPASRSRSPKKIVLKQSQLAIAKKLGLTPEQYVRELMKMEN